MAILEPRVIRALKRIPQFGNEYVKADPDYACWFWALSAFRPAHVPPEDLFSYPTELVGQGEDGRTYRNDVVTWGQLLAHLHMSPVVLGRHQVRLNALRAEWRASFSNRAHTAGKSRAVERISHEIAGIAAEVNGLSLSPVETHYEVCCHFPVDPAHTPGVDNESMGPNFTHWWLRIAKKVTIETFPRFRNEDGSDRITNLRFYIKWEQDHTHKKVSRNYVQELHQEHVNQIMAAIRGWKGAEPFRADAYPARQPWQPNAARRSCNWCRVVFGTVTPRRHHCRRCGKIFCDDCSSQRDRVDSPANEANQFQGGADRQRVCVTCYTPAD